MIENLYEYLNTEIEEIEFKENEQRSKRSMRKMNLNEFKVASLTPMRENG